MSDLHTCWNHNGQKLHVVKRPQKYMKLLINCRDVLRLMFHCNTHTHTCTYPLIKVRPCRDSLAQISQDSNDDHARRKACGSSLHITLPISTTDNLGQTLAPTFLKNL